MCEVCGGRGLVIVDDMTARRCDCMKLVAIKNKLQNAGIPGKKVTLQDFKLTFYTPYENIRLENVSKTCYQSAKDALKDVNRFVKEPDDGIVLVGPPGRGKTFLARCAAHELIARGHEVVFIGVPMLLAELKNTYNDNSERSEHQVLEAARKIKVLFLDDLGAHNYTDWVRTQLYSILDYRNNNRLPTFITTNLTIDQMKLNLGDRITSRIIDLCAIHYIDSESDIRTLKRKARNKAG